MVTATHIRTTGGAIRVGGSDATRYNPGIIKGHYYPAIDMTVFVNTLKDEVSVCRIGRASH